MIYTIDEIGNIGILTAMITEGRPTMMWLNPETKVFELKRQVIAYGTAGYMDKGKGQFENQFMEAVKAWRERDFSYAFVPIFIDCFSHPGITKEVYEEKKRTYYRNANQPNGERFKIQFHQHYPVTIEDMFLRSAETLIPMGDIIGYLDGIYSLPENEQPMYGYMVPIFDSSVPTPDLYWPYKVTGAAFRPLPNGDPSATVIIKSPPVSGWRNRSFGGIDPINTQEGLSDMAGGIYDAFENSVPAIMKFRDKDHQYCFGQALLLNIWYGVKQMLVERDIGQDFIDFCKYHGYYNLIMKNFMLPKHMQVSTLGEGISKKGHNAHMILAKLRELVLAYPENINIAEFWIQMQSYVQKINDKGFSKYERLDAHHKDDVIDAVGYSYICAGCFTRTPPEEINAPHAKKKKKPHYQLDANYNLKLVKE